MPRISWNHILLALGFFTVAGTVVWLFVEPGFDPAITLITGIAGIAALIASSRVSSDPIFTPRDHTVTDEYAFRNRRKMLAKVRSSWVDGVLQNSLHEAIFLDLGLVYSADSVDHPWDMILQRTGLPEIQISPNTAISDVFASANGALLILGRPGAGKTTTLLELARELLDRADSDSSVPVPAVFSLSSWSLQRLPIDEWLISELVQRYQVPRRIATTWINDDQLICLLDGLDEVDQQSRRECISLINHFREEHGLVDIAVCCRTEDYNATELKLRFDSAVVIQPLEESQIEAYIAHFGPRLATASLLLQEDQSLRELAKTPLFLSIIALAYLDLSVEEASLGFTDPEERRRHLFDVYVEQMLKRRATSGEYGTEDTLKWLNWLAEEMYNRSQSVFYIEQLRSNWLPSLVPEWQYQLSVAALAMPIVAITTGVANGAAFEFVLNETLGIHLPVMIASALGLCIFTWFAANRIIDWRAGTLVGIAVGIPFWIATSVLLPTVYAAVISVFAGTAVGATYMYMGRVSTRSSASFAEGLREIHIIETLSWSWRSASTGLRGGLVIAVLIGVTGAVVVALTFGIQFGSIFGIATSVAVLAALVVAAGVRGELIETRLVPNQGIRRSARTASVVAVAVGFTTGLSFGVAGMLLYGVPVGIAAAILFFLFGMSIGSLGYGGYACYQHFVLRYLMYRAGCIPLNYARFLDYTSECLLTRKVGGGYIFIHRYLMEYFVADAEPVSPDDAPVQLVKQ